MIEQRRLFIKKQRAGNFPRRSYADVSRSNSANARSIASPVALSHRNVASKSDSTIENVLNKLAAEMRAMTQSQRALQKENASLRKQVERL